MRYVNIRVKSSEVQLVVVMHKGELELLTSVASKNPRSRWVHVSPCNRLVLVCDGCRIIAIEDCLGDLPESGANYLVPIDALKALIKIMKAAHQVAITRDGDKVVLAIVESKVHHQFADDMSKEELGKVTYAVCGDAEPVGLEGLNMDQMTSMIERAMGPQKESRGSKFSLTTDFMKIIGKLPGMVKSHTSELFVGAGPLDPIVFQTTGTNGVRWTYLVMTQDPR